MSVRVTVVLSIFLVHVIAASTLFASEKVQLRAQDRVEIEQLMYEYNSGINNYQ